jgi:hypothetical protein
MTGVNGGIGGGVGDGVCITVAMVGAAAAAWRQFGAGSSGVSVVAGAAAAAQQREGTGGSSLVVRRCGGVAVATAALWQQRQLGSGIGGTGSTTALAWQRQGRRRRSHVSSGGLAEARRQQHFGASLVVAVAWRWRWQQLYGNKVIVAARLQQQAGVAALRN